MPSSCSDAHLSSSSTTHTFPPPLPVRPHAHPLADVRRLHHNDVPHAHGRAAALLLHLPLRLRRLHLRAHRQKKKKRTSFPCFPRFIRTRVRILTHLSLRLRRRHLHPYRRANTTTLLLLYYCYFTACAPTGARFSPCFLLAFIAHKRTNTNTETLALR